MKRKAVGTKPVDGSRDVDQYLAKVREPARSTLQKVRTRIRSVAPAEAAEAISYRIPSFQYKGGLVWYAAFAKHCSLFPMSTHLAEEFREELKNYQTSKGTIRFPMDKPPSAALVKKLVQARVEANERGSRTDSRQRM
ncbi:MAG TPA: DUF1801 domain-containing protein [Bryobacteraceae bacterium]|nr:DUF1801 domain-containing protein [Bryobacteraceae bacterium]